MLDPFSLFMIGLSFFVVAVTPGPANISNAIIAMKRGRKISLIYSAGLSFGLVFWGVIAASGMGAVLQSSVYLLMLLKVFGGLYLLWLAYLSGKSAFNPQVENINDPSNIPTAKKWFIRGFLLNISNPKTVIAWLAALSVGLDAGDNMHALVAGVLVCVFVGFSVNAMYSLVFSFSGVMNIYQRISRWINGIASALFTIAGIGLIRSAFNRSPV
ncbi:MAG: lysine transporter LysE [Methylophaga sp.]|jgi:threonine/homoserine/homoserine lactone efflux protein|uniref:LysE family translocator n=1 Tax=Methylophaga sp. UBA678 TaxID=1946901 RepID=UPI000C53BB2C|nr:LysE family translocator [Methylophaga sp. UBA678]MAX52449.1 lysine transporter LysE [Methylophaga sp.]|tara:strand:+ start:125508 stop:126149 length:642 start_codon:yes stop_codon:yes gene_type:complete